MNTLVKSLIHAPKNIKTIEKKCCFPQNKIKKKKCLKETSACLMKERK